MTIRSGEIIKRGRNGATCFHSLANEPSVTFRRKMEEMELKADTVRQVTSYSNHLSILINFPTVIKN